MVVLVRSVHNNLASKKAFYLMLPLFIAGVIYFSFQTMEVAYNLYVLLPLMGLLILYLLSVIPTRNLKIVILLLVLTASAGFLRRTVLFYMHLEKGVSYRDARKQLKRHPLSTTKTYATLSMFTVVDRPISLTDDIDDTGVVYKLVQQNSMGLQEPPQIPGFQLIENTFNAEPVKIAGLTIATSPPGYQYALYKRVEH